MRTCLGIFCGIIFLIASSFFIFVVNLNQTVYNAKFDKAAVNDSGLYKSIPEALVKMVESGKITASTDQELSPATKEIIIDTVKTVLTVDALKKHSESMIDQVLSDKVIVVEDLSDINNAVNSKLGSAFSEMMGVAISANSENTFVPKTVTFDKSQNQFGKSVIYHKKALWISLVVSLVFLILLFFVSASEYKLRLKWVGGFLIAAAVFALINFVVFKFVGFDWLIGAINSNVSENWIESMSSQLVAIVNLIRTRFFMLYLYEFGSIALLAVILFVISALIPAQKTVLSPAIATNTPVPKPKETKDVPKNS